MNTETLHEFALLTECPNLAVAARRLNLSPSSLSRHISELENELGVVLFTRKGGFSLTFGGRILLEEIGEMFAVEDRLRERLRSSKQAIQANFKVQDYMFSQRIKNLMLAAVNRFHHDYPGVHFEFVPTKVGLETVDALKTGYFDLAVLVHCGTRNPDFSAPEGLCTIPIDSLQSPIYFYVKKSDFPNITDSQSSISISLLRDMPFVFPLRPEYANFKADLTWMCQQAGFSPKLLLIQMKTFEDLAMMDMSGCVQVVLETDISYPDSLFLQNSECRCIRCEEPYYATPYFIFREPDSDISETFFAHLKRVLP